MSNLFDAEIEIVIKIRLIDKPYDLASIDLSGQKIISIKARTILTNHVLTVMHSPH